MFTPKRKSEDGNQLVLGLAIVAITLATYVPALHGGFVWDDYGFFIDNPLVENPHGLHDIWLSTESQDYFALTSTMLWAEWQAWGMNPVGYHVVNVLLHAAAAVLLWRVLRRLRIPGAWLGAALFAVHPVATLSAAWITEGKNTLSLALYLLALWAFLDYDERGGKGRYFLSLAAFLLALLAKGSVVVLPFVLLLCAWWRRDRITRKDVARSLPFFALALVMGLVTTWFQWHNAIRGGNVRLPGEGADSIIAASGWVVWFYLFKDLLPAGLTAIYPRWEVDGSSLPAWLPLLLLIGGLAWLWMRRKTWGRAPLFAAAYFLIGLLPVLGFHQDVVHAAVAGLGPFPVRGDDRHHGARRRHPGAGRGRARLDGAHGNRRGGLLSGGPGVRRLGSSQALRRRGAFLAG